MKLVLSNLPPDRADATAEQLIAERLAACVNLMPIRSVYLWNGKVEREPEVTLLAKVPAAGVVAAVERLRELHPYELPEILVLDIDAEHSLADYVGWVKEVCGRTPAG